MFVQGFRGAGRLRHGIKNGARARHVSSVIFVSPFRREEKKKKRCLPTRGEFKMEYNTAAPQHSFPQALHAWLLTKLH